MLAEQKIALFIIKVICKERKCNDKLKDAAADFAKTQYFRLTSDLLKLAHSSPIQHKKSKSSLTIYFLSLCQLVKLFESSEILK